MDKGRRMRFVLGFGFTFICFFSTNIFVLGAVDLLTTLPVLGLGAACAGLAYLVGVLLRDGIDY